MLSDFSPHQIGKDNTEDQIKAKVLAMSVESKKNEKFKISPGPHGSENVDKTVI